MDRRIVDGPISIEYKEDVKNFCDYTFENIALLVEGQACCPYNKYVNREIHYRDTIIAHLYKSEFMRNYKYWYAHREIWKIIILVRNHQ